MFTAPRNRWPRLPLWSAWFAVLPALLLVVQAAAPDDPHEVFFRSGPVPSLRIQIEKDELDKLNRNNRAYVRCTVLEGDQFIYSQVGVHLKGAAGSFRPVNDRPALTLNFDKFREHQRFHGLDKIHLNNSVQDGTYLHEYVSAAVFNAAGLPALRIGHARVWLNGRDLGFYVFKEGFDTQFLKRNFGSAKGNFYDGGFCADLDAKKDKKSGSGPNDQSDLKAVVAAAREPDLAKRWTRLNEVLDVNLFLTLVAGELFTCHWDGYVRNRNNYRLYVHPLTGKLVFMPSGMDQMFNDPNFTMLDGFGGLVTSGLMQIPQAQQMYRSRESQLLTNVWTTEFLTNTIWQAHQRIRPVLEEMGKQHAQQQDGAHADLRNRLIARVRAVEKQLGVPPPPPPPPMVAGQPVKLTRWEPQSEGGEPAMNESAEGGVKSLEIRFDKQGRCVASWRSRLTLDTGKYRFEGRVRTAGVVPLKEPTGEGAGLRISGSSRPNRVSGDSDWQKIAMEFDVANPAQEIVLVCELRAERGRAWFDLGSLQVVRQP